MRGLAGAVKSKMDPTLADTDGESLFDGLEIGLAPDALASRITTNPVEKTVTFTSGPNAVTDTHYISGTDLPSTDPPYLLNGQPLTDADQEGAEE